MNRRRPPNDWTRCHYYLEKKHRFCRQQVVPESKSLFTASTKEENDDDEDSSNNNNNDNTLLYKPRYCGNHIYLIDSNEQKHQQNDNDNNKPTTKESKTTRSKKHQEQKQQQTKPKRKWIPCPIDSSHYIYEDNIDKHIKICPKVKRQKITETNIYYKHNVNIGGHGGNGYDYCCPCNNNLEGSSNGSGGSTEQQQSNNDEAEEEEEMKSKEWAKQLAIRIIDTYQRIFHNRQDDNNNDDTTTYNTRIVDVESKEEEEEEKSSTNNNNNNNCKKSFDEMYNLIPTIDLSEKELQKEGNNKSLENDINKYRIRCGGTKHLIQQASLIGHLRRIDANSSSSGNDELFFDSNNTSNATTNTNNKNKKLSIIEMGAGRGMFGLLAAGVASAAASTTTTSSSTTRDSNVHLLLVEKAGTRSKADTVLRSVAAIAAKKKKKSQEEVEDNSNKTRNKNYLKLENLQWTRIQCDLAHVHIPTVLSSAATSPKSVSNGDNNSDINGKQKEHEPKQHKLLVVAKHLCGAGTDIALKSLRDTISSSSSSSSNDGGSIRDTSICIATCCHGLCTWNDYVGRDYLRNALLLSTDKDNNSVTMTSNSNEGGSFDFGPKEFELMRRWTSGTVLDVAENEAKDEEEGKIEGMLDNEDEDEEEHSALSKNNDDDTTTPTPTTTTTPLQDKDVLSPSCAVNVTSIVNELNLQCGVQGFGRMCQRLIDYGRCEYIRLILFNGGTGTSNGNADGNSSGDSSNNNNNNDDHSDSSDIFVKLCHYVKPDITPQNAVLIAYRRKKNNAIP